jgi:hypothetical protein
MTVSCKKMHTLNRTILDIGLHILRNAGYEVDRLTFPKVDATVTNDICSTN